ncbi:countin-3-like [Gigantopelta aegis]|uniref:countin-3-like n=1 Tax=Gigantopelta aegis TaxID=1735272 RepID=UPI001B887AB1|nr:countin-3-like [Gigantopelta aegis]
MKVLVAVLVSVFMVQTVAGEVVMRRRRNQVLPSTQFITIVTRTSRLNYDKLDMCPLCIDFADEAIEILISLSLDIGVIDSCGVLCDLLASKTGSQVLGALCNFFCDIEGAKEFAKILQKEDLDDIYFCELVKGCPVFDGGDARITELTISPVSGPPGEREIDFSYVTRNGTGTGQLEVHINTVDKLPLDIRLFNEAAKPGAYSFRFMLDAEKSDDCHPEKFPCETWKKGNYTLVISVCNGECGSKHPHSSVYDIRLVGFTITE